MTKYIIRFYYEDELITGIDDMIFDEKSEAGLYGLGCVRAYRFITCILEKKIGDSGKLPLDTDADLGFEVVPIEV